MSASSELLVWARRGAPWATYVGVAAIVAGALASEATARGDEQARAHGASNEDVESARQLFERGKWLLGEGKIAEACKSFEESEALAPAGGTLLNLAECRASAGAYASAQSALESARALARAAGREDARRFIDEKLEALAKKVSHLRVELPSSSNDDAPASVFVVRIDDHRVEARDDRAELAVDPGVHTIAVESKGRVAFHATVTVQSEGTLVAITVPTLQPLAAPIRPVAAIVKPVRSGASTPTVVGWSLAAAGGTALAVGAVLGSFALSRAHTAHGLCPGVTCRSIDGVAASREAGSLGDGATAALVSGGALAVAGVTMILLTQPPSHPRNAVGLATEMAW